MAQRLWTVKTGEGPERFPPAALAGHALSYPEVGQSWTGSPEGYHLLEGSHQIPAELFDRCAERLMTWQVQRRGCIGVAVSSDRVKLGSVVELVLGPPFMGPPRWGVRAACRVVEVIEEPDRVGFAYGSLVGHPEQGEECFLLSRGADGCRFTIRAFSRPSRLARFAGPVGRAVQVLSTNSYLSAIVPDTAQSTSSPTT